MKTIFIILSLISLLFLASSCPKKDGTPKNSNPQLPDATQTGANTFGCKINGQIWVSTWTNSGPPVQAQYYKGYLSLAATKKVNSTVLQSIRWAYQPMYSTGKYYFKSAPNGGSPGAQFADYINTTCGSYSSNNQDSLSTYIIITKLDTANRIVSGTFNLLFTSQGCDTLKITDGRFDAKYDY